MSKKKSIILACKESPERLPPIFSLLESLSRACDEVILITSNTSPSFKQKIENLNIKVFLSNENKKIKESLNIFQKAHDWFKFRALFWKVRKEFQSNSKYQNY